MLEENKALSRRFIEGYVRGDTDIVDELLAPDFVFYDPSSRTGEVRAEDMKASTEWIHSAFPDAQVTIEDQVARGELDQLGRARLAPRDRRHPLAGVQVTL